MVDVTVAGELGYTENEQVDALLSEVDALDESVGELFFDGITREGFALQFDVRVGLQEVANTELQAWLEDAAEQAAEGAVVLTQDGEAVQLDAGGGATPM